MQGRSGRWDGHYPFQYQSCATGCIELGYAGLDHWTTGQVAARQPPGQARGRGVDGTAPKRDEAVTSQQVEQPLVVKPLVQDLSRVQEQPQPRIIKHQAFCRQP